MLSRRRGGQLVKRKCSAPEVGAQRTAAAVANGRRGNGCSLQQLQDAQVVVQSAVSGGDGTRRVQVAADHSGGDGGDAIRRWGVVVGRGGGGGSDGRRPAGADGLDQDEGHGVDR